MSAHFVPSIRSEKAIELTITSVPSGSVSCLTLPPSSNRSTLSSIEKAKRQVENEDPRTERLLTKEDDVPISRSIPSGMTFTKEIPSKDGLQVTETETKVTRDTCVSESTLNSENDNGTTNLPPQEATPANEPISHVESNKEERRVILTSLELISADMSQGPRRDEWIEDTQVRSRQFPLSSHKISRDGGKQEIEKKAGECSSMSEKISPYHGQGTSIPPRRHHTSQCRPDKYSLFPEIEHPSSVRTKTNSSSTPSQKTPQTNIPTCRACLDRAKRGSLSEAARKGAASGSTPGFQINERQIAKTATDRASATSSIPSNISASLPPLTFPNPLPLWQSLQKPLPLVPQSAKIRNINETVRAVTLTPTDEVCPATAEQKGNRHVRWRTGEVKIMDVKKDGTPWERSSIISKIGGANEQHGGADESKWEMVVPQESWASRQNLSGINGKSRRVTQSSENQRNGEGQEGNIVEVVMAQRRKDAGLRGRT